MREGLYLIWNDEKDHPIQYAVLDGDEVAYGNVVWYGDLAENEQMFFNNNRYELDDNDLYSEEDEEIILDIYCDTVFDEDGDGLSCEYWGDWEDAFPPDNMACNTFLTQLVEEQGWK